jgi:hypothetical protein
MRTEIKVAAEHKCAGRVEVDVIPYLLTARRLARHIEDPKIRNDKGTIALIFLSILYGVPLPPGPIPVIDVDGEAFTTYTFGTLMRVPPGGFIALDRIWLPKRRDFGIALLTLNNTNGQPVIYYDPKGDAETLRAARDKLPSPSKKTAGISKPKAPRPLVRIEQALPMQSLISFLDFVAQCCDGHIHPLDLSRFMVIVRPEVAMPLLEKHFPDMVVAFKAAWTGLQDSIVLSCIHQVGDFAQKCATAQSVQLSDLFALVQDFPFNWETTLLRSPRWSPQAPV